MWIVEQLDPMRAYVIVAGIEDKGVFRRLCRVWIGMYIPLTRIQ